MKAIYSSALALFLLSITQVGCSPARNTTVGKSANLEAEFDKIETFAWTTDIDQIPNDKIFIGANGVYVFNNESSRKMIKEAVKYELDARGYDLKNTDADILVNYYVLEQESKLPITNGYVMVGGEKLRTEDNISYTDVKPGTLIVNFINTKSGEMIWQGFASGILKPQDLTDQAKIRQAVSSIFSKYQYNNHS